MYRVIKKNTVDVNVKGHPRKYDVSVQGYQKYNRSKCTGSSKEIQ